ncbi:MAG: GH92 family glycosyl hydrolase [Melioribacteraceae bacterium]
MKLHKKIIKGIVSLVGILFFTACSTKDITQYVDPNIGGVSPLLTTKAPTVHRPHSMVRVFPITKSGLEDRFLSDKIYGFTVNMPAYRRGYVTELMPTSGKLIVDRDENAATYDHDMEEVHPWYHKVLLEEPEIAADWTTTERSVIYRFQFNKSAAENVLFRSKRNSSFKIVGNNVVQGWEEFEGTKQFFYAEFSRSFNNSGTFEKGKGNSDVKEIFGQKVGVFVSLNKSETPLEVRIGISFIDENQARDNVNRETKIKTFEQVKNESYSIWSDALSKIKVEGGTERQKRIFYTSLYRSYERMINISEYGRYFSGFDKKVHNDEGRPFYVDDWLWDTYRSLHPLMLILDPSKQSDMVQSYIRAYEQSGWMPGFPQYFGEFSAMVGFHSAALVWDTYQKGVKNFDIEKAYEGLKKNAMQATMVPWRSGEMCSLDSFYIKHGWFPAINENEKETEPTVDDFEKRQSVAVTLEHSYDDWCLAQFAKALGKNSDFEYFQKRSQNFRNLFNPATGFFQPKDINGKWIEPFSPQLSSSYGARMYYTENNAWTWNFSVQQDIPGLIDLLGGKENFIKRVDAIFNEAPEISKWKIMGQFPDATGLNGMFVAGNEPSMHIPYLYNYAGQAWKTQRRVREVLDMWFDDKPLGLPGDEDGGGLCSWYVFSAMGFFPVTVGSSEYAIGSPFFEKISIQLPNGKTFTVYAKNSTKKNKYVQSAELNGKELTRSFINHSDIIIGGTLNLIMGKRPNKEWGK